MPAERGYADIGRGGSGASVSRGGGQDRGQMLSKQREADRQQQQALREVGDMVVQGGGLDLSAARQRQQQELAAQAAMAANIARQEAQRQATAEAERFARQQRIMQEQGALSRYQPVRDPQGNIVGQITPPSQIPMGIMPLLFSALPFEQRVYSGDPRYDPFDISNRFSTPERGGRPQQVAPVQDPMTGQARCPEGYVFSETLQACIMDTSATSPIEAMPPSYTPPSGGYYARQGLLDQPPAGLLEAGFGTPQDFAAANTAFRMGAATRPDIYSDPYNLQGYTLLS